MAIYEIKGRNILFVDGEEDILEYKFRMEMRNEGRNSYLRIIDKIDHNLPIQIEKLNIFRMIKEFEFKLDENLKIVDVINYEEIKDTLEVQWALMALKYAEYREMYMEAIKKISKKEEFIESIYEVDYIRFLYSENKEYSIIHSYPAFIGVDLDLIIKMEKEGENINYTYEIEKTSLNKLLLNSRMENEDIVYDLKGKGRKIFENGELKSGSLKIELNQENVIKKIVKIDIDMCNNGDENYEER